MSIEHDLERARRDGVTLPENLPFLLAPAAPRASVLLVHGFSASPWEMLPLARHLAKEGCLCYGVRLPGHGTTPQDLATRSARDWMSVVDGALQGLSRQGLPLFAVGQSTGALTLLAAAGRSSLAGMVLLSPFLKLRHPLVRLTGLLHPLRPYQVVALPEGLRPYYYRQRPLRGIREILGLARRVARGLGGQTTPALVIASAGDRTTAAGSALDLFRRLGSRPKAFHLFGPDIPHVLSTAENPRLERVCELVAEFILAHTPSPPAA